MKIIEQKKMFKLKNLILFCLVFTALSVFAQPKYEYYDEDKKHIKSEEHFIKGISHGKITTYFKNGKVSKIGWNKYGKRDSVWKYFYEEGKLKAEESFTKGIKNGRNLYYYKSGKPAQLTLFDFDRPDSIWTSWHENGNVKGRESFLTYRNAETLSNSLGNTAACGRTSISTALANFLRE